MTVNLKAKTSVIAARIAGESSAMDAAAERVAARARQLATSHIETGAYERSIGVERVPGREGVTDRLVYADDVAANVIEFGHVTSTGKRVPGQFILTRAAKEA